MIERVPSLFNNTKVVFVLFFEFEFKFSSRNGARESGVSGTYGAGRSLEPYEFTMSRLRGRRIYLIIF